MLTQANSKLADIIAEQEAIFVKRQPKSAALAGRAKHVLAGGVTSNWQITKPQPVWLSHGAGSKVYDADGNEYVDLHGGYGANRVPALVERVVYLGAATQVHLRLATGESLQAVVPNEGTAGWSQGTPVHVHLPADALRVLAGDAEPAPADAEAAVAS